MLIETSLNLINDSFWYTKLNSATNIWRKGIFIRAIDAIISFQSRKIFGLSICKACPVCVINLSDTFSTTCALIWGRRKLPARARQRTTPAFLSLNIYIIQHLFSAAFPRSLEIQGLTGKRLHLLLPSRNYADRVITHTMIPACNFFFLNPRICDFIYRPLRTEWISFI